MIQNLIILILIFPIIGIFFLLLIPSRQEELLKSVALTFACFSFTFSLVVWGFFTKSIGPLLFVTTFLWLPFYNFTIVLGVDGIAIFFLILTTLLIPLCLLACWNSVSFNLKEFLIAFLFLDFLLIGSYVFFEMCWFI